VGEPLNVTVVDGCGSSASTAKPWLIMELGLTSA
jgi:hypothetical protein